MVNNKIQRHEKKECQEDDQNNISPIQSTPGFIFPDACNHTPNAFFHHPTNFNQLEETKKKEQQFIFFSNTRT